MKEYTVRVFEDGSRCWYLHSQYHREDGPVIERADGSKFWWYLHGKLHREDGPAIEYADGGKEWWLNGKPVTKEEHKRRTSKVTTDDTRLAAAAPELLEMLDALVDFVKLIGSGGDPIQIELLTKARAAIAKAKGEEQ